MDPKLLYHLSEVIEQGSMSQAAVKLRITQPTLTRNIKLIEDIVGAPVLLRGRYGVTPTDIGERLTEHGKNILNSMASADEAILHWKAGLIGEIRLGVGYMFASTMIPGFLATQPLADSNFTVNLLTDSSANLLQKLRKDDINMAILPTTGLQSTQLLIQLELFSDQACILAGSKSPLLNIGFKIRKELLAKQPWITINRVPRLRHTFDEFWKCLGMERVVPKITFDGDVSAPIQFMRNSELLTFMPRRFAQSYSEETGVQILEVDVTMPPLTIALCFTKENQQDPGVQEMTKKLISYFREDNQYNAADETPGELNATPLAID